MSEIIDFDISTWIWGYVHFDKMPWKLCMVKRGRVRYGETYDTVVSARDFAYGSFMDTLANESAGRPGAVRVADLMPQPFLGNTIAGKPIHLGIMSMSVSRKCFLFITPSSEPTNVHIVMLNAINDEATFLVRTDVLDQYFGDREWERCSGCDTMIDTCECLLQSLTDKSHIKVIKYPDYQGYLQVVTHAKYRAGDGCWWSTKSNTGSFDTSQVSHRSLDKALSAALAGEVYLGLWDPFTGQRVSPARSLRTRPISRSIPIHNDYLPNHAYFCKNALFMFADIRKHPSPHDLLDPGITSHGWWEPCTDGIFGTTWFPNDGTVILWTFEGPIFDTHPSTDTA